MEFKKGAGTMTVIQYLQQAFLLNQKINDKLEELGRLRALSTSIGAADTSQEKISTGKVSDIVGNTVPRIIELNSKINADIDKCCDKKQQIEKHIEKIKNNNYRLILLKRYIHFKEWEDICNDLGYSYRHITRLHSEALQEFRKILKMS